MTNKIMKFLMLLLLPVCFSMQAFAQDAAPEMADTMRSNGKIYVVVAVCLLILVGLFIYLVRLDSRLRKLEKGNY
jgi:hypothetical protein